VSAAEAEAAPRDGVVFVATGAGYVALAADAAASLRRVSPTLPIDLFTDAPADLPVFDRVHILENPWRRSKIDGLRLSRFERTLFLDADVKALAPVDDVFELLDRFDIALAHDQMRNGDWPNKTWRRMPPNAFAELNSGVIALRRSDRTDAFLRRWAEAVRESDHPRDQPALRELLWESDLRLAILPEEYNLMVVSRLSSWWTWSPAPRIVHSPRFHVHFTRGRKRTTSVEELLGPALWTKLPILFAADHTLDMWRGVPAREPTRADRLRRYARIARGHAARLLRRLGGSTDS
jgi:hypothetical protein